MATPIKLDDKFAETISSLPKPLFDRLFLSLGIDEHMHSAVQRRDMLEPTPPYATKAFKTTGGFSGKSINPAYIDDMLTLNFGQHGKDWFVVPKFEETNGSFIPNADNNHERIVICHLEIKDEHDKVMTTGTGSGMVASLNKNGFYTDREAYKKSVTDAKSHAAKNIGIGIDIHKGRHDNLDYVKRLQLNFDDYYACYNSLKTISDMKDIKEIFRNTQALRSPELSLGTTTPYFIDSENTAFEGENYTANEDDHAYIQIEQQAAVEETFEVSKERNILNDKFTMLASELMGDDITLLVNQIMSDYNVKSVAELSDMNIAETNERMTAQINKAKLILKQTDVELKTQETNQNDDVKTAKAEAEEPAEIDTSRNRSVPLQI